MKNKCLTEQKIWEYIDQELGRRERMNVEYHLKRCPECNEEYQMSQTLHMAVPKIIAKKIKVQ